MLDLLNTFYETNSKTLFVLADEFLQIAQKLKELARYRLEQEKMAEQIEKEHKRLHLTALRYALGQLDKIPKEFSRQQLEIMAHSRAIIAKKNKINQRFLRIKVLRIAQKGYLNKEIAEKLHIIFCCLFRYFHIKSLKISTAAQR